ncbi:MAG TPA: hypothetical protein VL017_03085 [Devosia sp.]|nr:hypothetical protein [Devosia sp.]
MPRRDPKRMAGGKLVVMDVIAARSIISELPQQSMLDAIYYLDGTLFLPRGGAKAGRLLRNEAKKRGVL